MAKSLDFKQMVADFANDNPSVQALQFIRDDPTGLILHHIEGHGSVNYVFKVTSTDKKFSVIIKYGEERMRLAPDEEISLDRQELEFNCLKLMESIQAGSVPEPYCLDKKHSMIAMEDMSSWDLLGFQLKQRIVDLEAASYLGHLLGHVHWETSQGAVTPEKWNEYLIKYEQKDNKLYTQCASFKRSFEETDKMNLIPDNILEQYRAAVVDIKGKGILQRACDLFDLQMCFIHGDCHYKSIFVKDGKVALFDFEFAFLGHPAFNVAFPLLAYLLSYVFDEAHPAVGHTGPNTATLKVQCVQAMKNMMESYLKIHMGVSRDESTLQEFMSAAALFTGALCFMVSVFGKLEHMIDLKEGDRALMLDIGTRMMKGYAEVHTLKQLLDLANTK